MNPLLQAILLIYSKSLHSYRQRFQDEFAEEMQVVFRDSVNDAARDGILSLVILCLRELSGLPFNILQEFWHEFERKETLMLRENIVDPPEEFTTTGQVIIGTLPFFLFGLFLILLELPFEWNMPAWMDTVGGFVFAFLLILPAIGFAIGWAQGFPRWSYPYVGMAFLWALYTQNASTPGLHFFGIPIFGRELWGWRAWIPLAAAFVIALAVSRSLKPFVKFFTNLWNDWSIPSYFMIAALPLLVTGAFDEIDRLYSLYFMVPFAVLLVAMVIFYLRSKTAWQRVLVLTLGIPAILLPAALGSNSYWLAHHGTSMSNTEVFVRAGKAALVMLIPAWLELLRRAAGRLRTA